MRFFYNASKLVNCLLSLDQETLSALTALQNKIFEIELLYTNLNLFITPVKEGIKLSPHCDRVADVMIKGTPSAFLAMLTDGKVGIGNVEINGNLKLAQQFQSILKHADFDWEDYLSQYLGDPLAYQTGKIVRGTKHFIRRLGEKIALDTSEYLRYEKAWLPDQFEVESFCQAVDTLRDDVERITERVTKLERND